MTLNISGCIMNTSIKATMVPSKTLSGITQVVTQDPFALRTSTILHYTMTPNTSTLTTLRLAKGIPGTMIRGFAVGWKSIPS